jgi:hypothetical protein
MDDVRNSVNESGEGCDLCMGKKGRGAKKMSSKEWYEVCNVWKWQSVKQVKREMGWMRARIYVMKRDLWTKEEKAKEEGAKEVGTKDWQDWYD